MYLDRGSSGNRTGWRYTYRGRDLRDASKRLMESFKKDETKHRNDMAALLKDETVAASDKRIDELKRKIEAAATSHEECSVFYHEFSQRLDAEYSLVASDVVYFGFPTYRSDKNGPDSSVGDPTPEGLSLNPDREIFGVKPGPGVGW